MNTTITALAGTAGRITGHAAAAAVWVYKNTDWAEVWEVVLQGLKVAIVLTLLAGRATRRAWDALPGLSEQLGCWYAARVAPVALPAYQVAPVPARVEVRQHLEALTCRQLRDLTGIRRKVAKAQLIELALAA
jgi:hypothetical protein